MKLDPIILDALNQQVNRERQNSVPYAAMSNRARLMALPGLTHFFHESSNDELFHAQKLTKYIIARNDEVTLMALQGYVCPVTNDMATLGVTLLTAALALEEANTLKLKALCRMAADAGDEETSDRLIWFIREQTHSVNEITDMVAQWGAASRDIAAVFKLDQQLEK